MKILDRKEYNENDITRLLTCSDSRVALIRDVHRFNFDMVRTEAYVTILCTQGSGQVRINDREYELGKGKFVSCRPYTIVENGTLSDDFEYLGIIMTPDFMKEYYTILVDGWNVWLNIDRNPVYEFSKEAFDLFVQYWHLLYAKLTGPRLPHHYQLITSLLAAFAYEFRDYVEDYARQQHLPFADEQKRNYASSDKLYKRFMELLTASFPKKRDVSFYASHLCVTPKYLSAVCKQTTGETASQIIYKYVVNDVKMMLRRKDLTIKEVAFKLGFDNLSFFGKYTKRALGMSPKAFRYSV